MIHSQNKQGTLTEKSITGKGDPAAKQVSGKF